MLMSFKANHTRLIFHISIGKISSLQSALEIFAAAISYSTRQERSCLVHKKSNQYLDNDLLETAKKKKCHKNSSKGPWFHNISRRIG